MRFNQAKSLWAVIFLFIVVSCTTLAPLKPLPKNAVIIAFGDSLTAGVGTSPDKSYPAILATLTGMKVINAGVSGDTTTTALPRLPELLAEHHPNLVIICLGGNDRIRHMLLDVTKNNLKSMIDLVQQSGAEVLLISEPELKLTLSVPALYSELGEEYNIPVDNKILSTLLKNREYKSDTIHLNQQGYQIMAEKIKELLQQTGAIP